MRRKKKVVRRDAGRARGAPVEKAVLAATLEELANAGPEALSVERVAVRAEVNKTSVYRRWPTREALVAAALEGTLEHFSAVAADTGSLRGDLLALLGPVAAMLGSPAGRALARAAMSEAAGGPVAALAATRLSAPARGPVAALVRRARVRGEWRAGVRGDAVLSMLVGAVLHRVFLEHGALSGRWLRSTVELVVAGVAPRPATRRTAR